MATNPAAQNLQFDQGIANFSFNLYSGIQANGNEFLAPYSICSALLLLMLGTDGTTKHQMMTSIFSTELPTNLNLGYYELNRQLEQRTQNGVTLSVANRLFGSQIFSVLNSYKVEALRYYSSELELLDFARKPEESRNRINSWIATKTNNKITDMLPLGILGGSTVMVVANAVYFKGTWKTKFNPMETKKRNFLVSSSSQREVDMMYGRFQATSGENVELDCKVLELPYIGEKLSMIFVLPNTGTGLSQLEGKLTHSTFQRIVSRLRKQDTLIRIPKFKIEAEYDLKPILISLGMTEIFDSSVSNFSKMVQTKIKDKGIYVSDARHKTYLVVNEEGSEAAASTTLVFKFRSREPKPFEFIADHPFMSFIIDKDTGIPLFIGRYANP